MEMYKNMSIFIIVVLVGCLMVGTFYFAKKNTDSSVIETKENIQVETKSPKLSSVVQAPGDVIVDLMYQDEVTEPSPESEDVPQSVRVVTASIKKADMSTEELTLYLQATQDLSGVAYDGIEELVAGKSGVITVKGNEIISVEIREAEEGRYLKSQ